MKKLFLLIMGIAPLVLCGCVEKPGPDYGEDYSTPEFFLARINPDSTFLSISSKKHTISDENLEVRDAIFKYEDYNSVEKRKPTINKYFTYSTTKEKSNQSGTIFVSMLIYVDGNIRIDYKESLKSKVSFYYEMDASGASNLYDLVERKVTYDLSKK